jgi:hypothetical protein
MATETLTELELLHRFIGKELAAGKKSLTVKESLERFEEYQRDIAKLQEALRPALEEAARGEGHAMDWKEFFRRNEERLRAMGIPE